MDIKSFFNKNKFTIFLLLVMIAITIFVFSAGKQAIKDVPQINVTMGVILILVGLAAGLLGGWIGTGGCSVMLPILHFWLGFPAPIAVGTTLFAVIFTAISGGYGHFKQKNVDKRVSKRVKTTHAIYGRCIYAPTTVEKMKTQGKEEKLK